MKIRVLVIGPRPASPGGVGVLMRHLENTSSATTELTYVDSGATGPRRLLGFLRLTLWLLVSSKRFDLAHVNLASKGSTLRKFLLTMILFMCKKPYLLHLHGGGFEDFYRQLAGFPQSLVLRMFSRAAKVVVLGTRWQDFVHRQLGVDACRILVLPNGVPGPKSVTSYHRDNTALFAGRLSPAKGVPELISAFKLIDPSLNWSLTLAGDCIDTEILDELRDTRLPISWDGWLDRSEIDELMANSKIFVLPSHTEGLPLALLDAMSHGAVPIVTPVGSIPEVVTSGYNGIIVPVNDHRALSEAIHRVLSEPKLAIELASNARRTWEQFYSIANFRSQLDVIYEEILETVDGNEC